MEGFGLDIHLYWTFTTLWRLCFQKSFLSWTETSKNVLAASLFWEISSQSEKGYFSIAKLHQSNNVSDYKQQTVVGKSKLKTFEQFDKIIMLAKNIQVQVLGVRLDSQKELDLKMVDSVKEIEKDRCFMCLLKLRFAFSYNSRKLTGQMKGLENEFIILNSKTT